MSVSVQKQSSGEKKVANQKWLKLCEIHHQTEYSEQPFPLCVSLFLSRAHRFDWVRRRKKNTLFVSGNHDDNQIIRLNKVVKEKRTHLKISSSFLFPASANWTEKSHHHHRHCYYYYYNYYKTRIISGTGTHTSRCPKKQFKRISN